MDSTDFAVFLVERMRISAVTKKIDLASAVVFFYDYLLTIGMEVKYIWPGPLTGMKVLYFLQRYLPFIDTVWIAVQVNFAPNMDAKTCMTMNGVGRSLMCLGLTLSELVLTFRAWAVWNRDRVLTFALPILFVGCFLPPVVIFGIFIGTTKFIGLPPPSTGCVQIGGDPIITINWILLLVWDALILILMVIPAIKAYRYRGNSALYRVVYGEGIVYYFYLFMLSTINIVLLRLNIDESYRFMLTSYAMLVPPRCLVF
ncbi:unnamed protein product [Cyclocybe aegerita]|uniref:DUF6533 domain-containing protein n=1 Tax=Cyclocybe aegerita TaxID=1973307 RepID=A0A8S0W509_CYCAE|nr:unnamed protein product [Cyclocybe aegerita]